MLNRTYFKSLAELVIVTYGTAFFGLIVADGFDLTSFGAWKSAAVAAAPAALAVVYGAFAQLRGNRSSALAVDTRDSGGPSDVR